ncbi:MAG TPA: hypothetical protein VK934_09695 [Fimbriimonas sp.]|nr:hypothetical protein [Fimbriimonas sp.]
MLSLRNSLVLAASLALVGFTSLSNPQLQKAAPSVITLNPAQMRTLGKLITEQAGTGYFQVSLGPQLGQDLMVWFAPTDTNCCFQSRPLLLKADGSLTRGWITPPSNRSQSPFQP